jgi:hypothetical protein
LTKLLAAEVEHHATAMLFDTSKAEIDLYPGKCQCLIFWHIRVSEHIRQLIVWQFHVRWHYMIPASFSGGQFSGDQ